MPLHKAHYQGHDPCHQRGTARKGHRGISLLTLFYMLAIFLVGLIGGRAPAKAGSQPDQAAMLDLGESFSGGIFLGAGLLHLLPDSADLFGQYAPDLDFPVASAIAGAGLLLVLLFDQIG